MSFIFSLRIIKVVVTDPNNFLLGAPSVTEAAAVNPNGTKTLLVSFY